METVSDKVFLMADILFMVVRDINEIILNNLSL